MTDGAEQGEAAAATPLPKCFCNWKNCRTYQKAFREYKHPIFNGVVKLKFVKDDRRSLALKAAVDRALKVDSTKMNDWKPTADGESLTCRYYVARHHFTETLMKAYLHDRRSWDWNQPLTLKQSKSLLTNLETQDVYLSESEDEGDDPRYVQAPNVPKTEVRDLLKQIKEDLKNAKESKAVNANPTTSPKASNKRESANSKKTRDSAHTQSTLSTTVTDTLKAFEDVIGHQEVDHNNSSNISRNSDLALQQKEEENVRLRHELNECQEQLTMLHSMVRQLKVDMDKTREPTKSKKSRKKSRKVVESSSEEESDSFEEEEYYEETEEEWSKGQARHGHSDEDDESMGKYQVNSITSSGHSRGNAAAARRKSSIHSRRSIRRDSIHNNSRRSSIHSRTRQSIRRDSIHSRRSLRGGGGMDDAASVVSRQSLQSVSPSIKSLPREIELMDDEEEDTQNGKDDYSFFDDSYRKQDDDARSVGSRSAASRASRRSIVSRNRGRNSRRPGGQGSTTGSRSRPITGGGGGNGNGNGSGRSSSGRGSNSSEAVPREIDLSGDELEDTTYANVSTDTLFVTDKQIVDPYGEKGVYTGALSKSTGMPNGKGRLEYEKEGRWYEGDWIHGRWTGYGRLSNGDGDFYEGGLKNDHKHGTGIMRFADGRMFEGEYIRGQMIQGKMTYQDGSVYGGSWVDGMRHGRGKCIFVDGSEYEGEFREGNFHGHGKMTWNDGGWYVGEWCEGEMHGKGKEIRPDGSLRHDGDWSRGQPIRSATDSRRRRQQQQHGQHHTGVEA